MGALAAAVPLAYLLIRAGQTGGAEVWETLWRGRTLELLVNSVGLAGAVTASCLLLGLPTAWLLTRSNLPAARFWLVVSSLPLANPSYVAAYGWVAASPGLSGFLPAWLLLTAVSTPYVTLPVAAAIKAADPALEEVARSLGRSRFEAWREGLLPQITPAAGAGGLLVTLYVLSDFGAVSMLRFEVFTFAISRQYGSYIGRSQAVILALVLVGLALSVVWTERRLRGRAAQWRVGQGAKRVAAPVALGRWTAPALVLLSVVPFAAIAVPSAALFSRLAEGTSRTFDPAELGAAILATCALAGTGALLATVLAFPIGMLAARFRGAVTSSLETLGFTGHALPGIVVGLSLVFLSLAVFPRLYQSAFMLVFAYAVLFLPKAIGSIRSSVGQVPPVLDDVARSLGRTRLHATTGITIRLASPGIAAGSLLVALTAMKELPATLLLRPTGIDTLSTEIWSRTAAAAYGAAAPYALALVLVASIPAFLLSRSSSWETEV
ncbi:MAG: ABC transporter permease [Aeromicrobium sp.]